jgi:hypothetical protein
MRRLGNVANRYGCAIVIVGHLGKSGGKAQYRGLGSVDIFAAARSVLTVGRLDLDSNMRALIQIKNNLTQTGAPQAFGLDDSGAFCWLGECDATISEFDGKRKQPDNQFTKARRLIETALAKGPIAAADIMEMAEEQGISLKTLNRAKTELGVVSEKRGAKWYWSLPIEAEYTVVGDEGHAGQGGQYGQETAGQDGRGENVTTMTTLTMLPRGEAV